jgi:hypothetical protein
LHRQGLDPTTEDPQIQHVARDMGDTGVQELAGDERHPRRRGLQARRQLGGAEKHRRIMP